MRQFLYNDDNVMFLQSADQRLLEVQRSLTNALLFLLELECTFINIYEVTQKEPIMQRFM